MSKDRNRQKQAWVHPDFHEWLKRIKARKLINGNGVNNIGDITEEIMRCKSFQELEKELLEIDKKILRIKMERKYGF